MNNTAKVEKALNFLDPNLERDEWVKVAMALKSEFGEDGIDLFNEWSEGGDTYKWNDLKATWDSITEDGGIGLGTLFHMAKKGGYKPSGKPLTPEEVAAYEQEDARRREQRKQEQEAKDRAKLEKHEAAARNAKAMLEHSKGNPFEDHVYMVRKGIGSFVSSHAGRYEDLLHIPMMDEKQKVWNIERIDSSGSKRGLKGGRRKGLFFPIKGKGGIVISEGFATAVSIHLATGMYSICAFGKSNLKAIAVFAREQAPKSRIIISGDVGSEESAIAAAQEIDAEVAIPCLFEHGSDFNDLHQAQGLDAVRDGIKAAVKVPVKVNDPLDWIDQYNMSEEEMDAYANPVWLYDDLIVSGQITAIMAEPGGGKTTMMMYVAGEMAASGNKVLYFNADTSIGDAKPMAKYAREHGFKFLLPDASDADRGMAGVVQNLNNMLLNTRESLEGVVFIFDTLKKMTDMMSKSASKALYSIFRTLSVRGATCIVLGHVNKHKDFNGNPVYEGVADLKNDIDAMYYLIPEHHEDGSMLITTKWEKKRSDFTPITFEVDTGRNVNRMPEAVDAVARVAMTEKLKKDADVIEAINEAILDGYVHQINVIEACNDSHRIGSRRVRKALQDYSGTSAATYSEKSGHLWHVGREGKNLVYDHLPRA